MRHIRARETVARTCCRTFIASWGVIDPLVMSSSKESVRAIPMLADRTSVKTCGTLLPTGGEGRTRIHGKTRSTLSPSSI